MTDKLEGLTGPTAELFRRGAHLGYSRSRRHPSSDGFIFGFKNRAAVIDLEKTEASLVRAAGFVQALGAAGKTVLWVGTKSEARPIIERTGRSLGLPFVTGRWIGGTLTNHSEIKKRLERLQELEEGTAQGRVSATMSKRDWAKLEKERRDLERFFLALKPLRAGLPAALVVVDSGEEMIAVAEAKKMKIPVIAVANTDCDINLIDYPIVGNDRSQSTIDFLVGRLAEAYAAGRASAPAPKAAEASTLPNSAQNNA